MVLRRQGNILLLQPHSMKTEQAKTESQSIRYLKSIRFFNGLADIQAGEIVKIVERLAPNVFRVERENGDTWVEMRVDGEQAELIPAPSAAAPVVRHTVKKEGDEWVVVCYVNGKRNEGRTYYASDKADAIATKDAMDQSAGLKA